MRTIEMEATHLRDKHWAVRPEGALGTFGWIDERSWTVIFVTAGSAEEALRKAGSAFDDERRKR